MFKCSIYKLYLRYHITLCIMKKSNLPQTKTYKPIPASGSLDWVIWAAWADRVTFEDIYKETGLHEKDVIKLMRKNLKKTSFKLWRERVHTKSIKNGKKFLHERKKLNRFQKII